MSRAITGGVDVGRGLDDDGDLRAGFRVGPGVGMGVGLGPAVGAGLSPAMMVGLGPAAVVGLAPTVMAGLSPTAGEGLGVDAGLGSRLGRMLGAALRSSAVGITRGVGVLTTPSDVTCGSGHRLMANECPALAPTTQAVPLGRVARSRSSVPPVRAGVSITSQVGPCHRAARPRHVPDGSSQRVPTTMGLPSEPIRTPRSSATPACTEGNATSRHRWPSQCWTDGR